MMSSVIPNEPVARARYRNNDAPTETNSDATNSDNAVGRVAICSDAGSRAHPDPATPALCPLLLRYFTKHSGMLRIPTKKTLIPK